MEADVNIVGGAHASQLPDEQSGATGTDFNYDHQKSFSSGNNGSLAHKQPTYGQDTDYTLPQAYAPFTAQ